MQTVSKSGIVRTCLKAILAFLLGSLTIMVFVNAVLRYGFGSSIVLADELSRLAFVWITFLGSILALIDGEHIGADFIVRALPGRAKVTVLLLSALAACGLLGLVCFGAVALIRSNWSSTLPVSGLPVAVQFAPVVIFALFALLFVIARVIAFVTGRGSVAALSFAEDPQHLAEDPRSGISAG